MARILSIEDDAELQHLIGACLFRAGFEVHYAFNGKEGYDKILSLRPDLILLDMMLPVLGGVEVIKLAMGNTLTRDIPIIVMTAFADQANTLEASLKAQGAREYVQKPFKVDEFVSLIRRVLKANPVAPITSSTVSKGKVRLMPQMRTVWIDDVLVATLPHKRAELLKALIEAKGGVKREKLVAALWGPEGSINVLEKTVQRLREDLGPTAADRIQTTPDGYELIG
jgi:DNA-binding response OmpR family regulator